MLKRLKRIVLLLIATPSPLFEELFRHRRGIRQ